MTQDFENELNDLHESQHNLNVKLGNANAEEMSTQRDESLQDSFNSPKKVPNQN